MDQEKKKRQTSDVLITDKHPHQKEIFNDITRFQIAVCGRRWGKTILGIEKALRVAFQKPYAKILIFAPTRQMVKELFWNQIKQRCKDLNWRIRLNESELKIQRLTNESSIQLLSADKPERARGRGVDYIILDEYAQMSEETWGEVLRPTLADRMGGALFIGTPNGRNHFFDLYQSADGNPDWRKWSFKTIDSPFIPREEIENARAQLDERTFRQEWEASFESYEGKAYCYYDADKHETEIPLNGTIPVIVCCDFNINPCIWEIGQNMADFTYIYDEVVQRQTDIWKMCATTKQRLERHIGSRAHQHRIIFYGDYSSSKQRDVSAVASSWQIIRDEFNEWNVEFRLKSNPRIIDRVNAVNSRMRSADGKIHFGHSARCVELRKDFDRVDMALLTGNKDEAGDRTHASDAVGYMINYEHPIHKISVVQQLV